MDKYKLCQVILDFQECLNSIEDSQDYCYAAWCGSLRKNNVVVSWGSEERMAIISVVMFFCYERTSSHFSLRHEASKYLHFKSQPYETKLGTVW